MNRRKKFITGVIVAMFVMMVIAPSMVQQQTNVRNDSTGTGYCGGTVCAKDLFGVVVMKHTFSTAWGFSWSNGNLVKEYTPSSMAHATVPYISWIHVHTLDWKQCSSNTYQAYGNVGYHVGIWYISITEHTYSAVTVNPHSYGSGQFSYGSGEDN